MQDSMVAILGKVLSILMLMPPFGDKLVTVRVSKLSLSLVGTEGCEIMEMFFHRQ